MKRRRWEEDADGNWIADRGMTEYETEWDNGRRIDFTATVHLRPDAPVWIVAHELAHVVLRHRFDNRVGRHGPKHRRLAERIEVVLSAELGIEEPLADNALADNADLPIEPDDWAQARAELGTEEP